MFDVTRPPKKIAIFLPSLRGGGAERMMVHLANGFSRRGFLVDLVLANAEGSYLPEVSSTVNLVNLRSKRVVFSLHGLVCYLRKQRPTALLSALNHANVVACIAHKISAVETRLVISERNTLSFELPTNLRGRVVPWFMRRVYPWAHEVVAVSQGVADDLVQSIGISSNKVRTIYNPVVNNELQEKAKEQINHHWFDVDASPVILGVGRLTKQKDFNTLIQAFARIFAKRPVRLLLLGEGDLRNELERTVLELGLGQSVSFLGFVSNPYAYMSRASVFVLSSRWEGLPGALIQAMACGTPVVSTDCPSGPREILENGKWGRLVPVGDADALALAIEQTLDQSTSPQVEHRARDFGEDQAVKEYLKVLIGASSITNP